MIAFGLDGYAAGMAVAVVRRPRRPRLLPLAACSRASRSAATWCARSLRACRRRSRSSPCGRLTDVDRTLGVALGELGLYVALTVVSTIAFERPLLSELFGYLRRGIRAAPAPG